MTPDWEHKEVRVWVGRGAGPAADPASVTPRVGSRPVGGPSGGRGSSGAASFRCAGCPLNTQSPHASPFRASDVTGPTRGLRQRRLGKVRTAPGPLDSTTDRDFKGDWASRRQERRDLNAVVPARVPLPIDCSPRARRRRTWGWRRSNAGPSGPTSGPCPLRLLLHLLLPRASRPGTGGRVGPPRRSIRRSSTVCV